MAFVLSTDLDPVRVQAFGNWFEFRPGQVKNMQDNLAHFLVTTKSYLGFVGVTDVVGDSPESVEAKKEKDIAIRLGRGNIKNHLNKIIFNLEVSMQKDIDIAGMKTTSTKFATDGEMEAYRKMAALNGALNNEADERAKEIEKLKEQINGTAAKSDSGPSDKRSSNSSKSAESR